MTRKHQVRVHVVSVRFPIDRAQNQFLLLVVRNVAREFRYAAQQPHLRVEVIAVIEVVGHAARERIDDPRIDRLWRRCRADAAKAEGKALRAETMQRHDDFGESR